MRVQEHRQIVLAVVNNLGSSFLAQARERALHGVAQVGAQMLADDSTKPGFGIIEEEQHNH